MLVDITLLDHVYNKKDARSTSVLQQSQFIGAHQCQRWTMTENNVHTLLYNFQSKKIVCPPP